MAIATLYNWLKFLHVLAAMVWVGGLTALAAFSIHVRRGGEPDAVARFVRSLRVIGPLTLAPSAILVVALGSWMVADSSAWDLGQTWVSLGLALLVAAVAVGIGFLSRKAIAAERAVAAGDHAGAARELARWSAGIVVVLVLLVVATWDMVFKPGL
jgi:uncharacterized membrane protein